MMGTQPVEYRFNVTRYWKGEVGMEARVFTNASSAACGRSYSKGTTYVIYGSLRDGKVRDSACSRTRSAENATDDYLIGLREAWPVVDYITVNLSSPNTPGLRDLQAADSTAALLERLKQEQELLSGRVWEAGAA